MSQVTIKVGGRSYPIACAPEDEAKVSKLGTLIDEYYAKLGSSRAPQEAHNVVFAALFMADELEETRESAKGAKGEIAEMRQELQQAKDDAANALSQASNQSEADKEKSGSKKAEMRAEIATLRKAEERSRKENMQLKAEIAEMQERARHQHDMFGGPAEDAALSEALAEKLESLAIQAEETASALEGSDAAS